MAGIPLVDLRAQYESIRAEIDRAIAATVESAAFVMGPAVGEFERAFATFCEVERAIGCGNGTDAIAIVLHALGVGRGDEVITVPNTFIATVEPISLLGATPVFVDVDPRTSLMDLDQVAAAVTPRTKAIIPVHLYGAPVDIEALRAKLPAGQRIAILEDTAQAHGARIRGRRVGSLGDAATFSFYPGKNLGAYGDGGAITTTNAELGKACAKLRDHGRADKYLHDVPGFNSRLDTLQAAVLNVKLPHLDGWNAARARVAAAYREQLAGIPELQLPEVAPGTEPVWHLFVVHHPRRDPLRQALNTAGIGAGIHYPVPLHLQPAYQSLGLAAGRFPVAERLSSTCLSLPMYPELAPAQIQQVCEAVRRALA